MLCAVTRERDVRGGTNEGLVLFWCGKLCMNPGWLLWNS